MFNSFLVYLTAIDKVYQRPKRMWSEDLKERTGHELQDLKKLTLEWGNWETLVHGWVHLQSGG